MGRALFAATLYLVFFLSGFAALIYQVVWQRAFTLYYGVGAISTSIVVSVFLFGLGVGAYLGGRLAERMGRWRLITYVGLEAALALMGALSMNVLAAVTPALSHASYTEGFAIIAALIALPTILMGMTLPLMVKITNVVNHNFGVTLARLYAVNTLGAAMGAMVAAYWLISFHGLRTAVMVAGAINALIAVAMLIAAQDSADRATRSPHRRLRRQRAAAFSPRLAAAIVLATGFLAIGYQMVWFRIIGTLLKPSAYVFSTVLAIYLTGIAFGSWAMAIWLRRQSAKPRSDERVLSDERADTDLRHGDDGGVLYVGAAAWPHWMVTTSFAEQLHPPYYLRDAVANMTTAGWKPLYLLFDLAIWPALLMLPATILMGAGFPLMNVLVLRDADREGQGTGLDLCADRCRQRHRRAVDGLLPDAGAQHRDDADDFRRRRSAVAARRAHVARPPGPVRRSRGPHGRHAHHGVRDHARPSSVLRLDSIRRLQDGSAHHHRGPRRRRRQHDRQGPDTGHEFVRVFIGGSNHATISERRL